MQKKNVTVANLNYFDATIMAPESAQFWFRLHVTHPVSKGPCCPTFLLHFASMKQSGGRGSLAFAVPRRSPPCRRTPGPPPSSG